MKWDATEVIKYITSFKKEFVPENERLPEENEEQEEVEEEVKGEDEGEVKAEENYWLPLENEQQEEILLFTEQWKSLYPWYFTVKATTDLKEKRKTTYVWSCVICNIEHPSQPPRYILPVTDDNLAKHEEQHSAKVLLLLICLSFSFSFFSFPLFKL
jgi:Zn-finger protein